MEEKIEATLLSENEVFGSRKLNYISETGAQCKASDCSISLGAFVDENLIASSWALINNDGTYVRTIDKYGNRSVCLPSSRTMEIRPVLLCPNINELIKGKTAKDGFIEIIFGEYPQKAVGRFSTFLEDKYQTKTFNETGKLYTFDLLEDTVKEYSFNGKKYIRLIYNNSFGLKLSNEKKYYRGDIVWLEVTPLKWIVIPEKELLLSKDVLLSGIRFNQTKEYDGIFTSTEAYHYLNNYFLKEIIPSTITKSPEEELEWKEREEAMIKRENPYNFNIQPVTEEDIIEASINSNTPVFLHGLSSDGKSARVRKLDPNCITLYMENVSLDGFVGKTVYNQKSGRMINIPPTWYDSLKEVCDKEPNKNHILFLEEFTNAAPAVQGKVNDLVLERVVDGKWHLPENVRIVAAGNEVEDSLAANPITETVFNRFAHVYIKTTAENWLVWARENHIHPAIYSYIAYRRDASLRTKYDGRHPNADPRKWEMASNLLYKTNNPEVLRALVGEEITQDFISFCKKSVITIEDVLTNNYKDDDLLYLNTSEKYATVMALSEATDEEVIPIREFVEKLGNEYVTVFDVLWSKDQEERLNTLAGLKEVKVLTKTFKN